jgi:hypothetical protein
MRAGARNCLHHARKKTIRTGDFFSCTEWFLLLMENGFSFADITVEIPCIDVGKRREIARLNVYFS